MDELLTLANDAYDNAVAAQESGDWAGYGRYLDELERYLNLLVPDAPAQETPVDTI